MIAKTESPALPVTGASFSEEWWLFASLGAVNIDIINIQIIEFCAGIASSRIATLIGRGLRIVNLLLQRTELKGRGN